MKPIDIRNDTFAEIRGLLEGDREAVYRSLRAGGPRTVRELAAGMERDVLSVAPRVAELFEIGAVELIDRVGHRGIYRARTEGEWILWHGAQRAGGEQLALAI